VLWHAAFWLAILAYHTLVFGTYSGAFGQELMWQMVALPPKMAAVYSTLYILLPRTFSRRRLLAFAAWATLIVLAAALAQRLIELAAVREFSNPYERADVLLHPIKVLRAVIGIYPVVALTAFIKVSKSWLRQDLESERLRREKLTAELRFLRAQIRPHFLFNTLNNLYALTLKRSETAADVVLKLSDMLEYMLYEGDVESVSLERELETVETYLELEKLRYGDRLDLTFEIIGDVTACSVPPLLILPLVENAFKHGISRQIDEGSIAIRVAAVDRVAEIEIVNSVPVLDESGAGEPGADKPGAGEPDTHETGIGLTNVRRRLDLTFEEAYELIAGRDGDMYRVHLRLDCMPPNVEP